MLATSTGQFTPGTYLVSGRANPIDGYQHLEGCTECDFIDWGWWGTRVEVAAGASDEIPDDRVDYVHMGTGWRATSAPRPRSSDRRPAAFGGQRLTMTAR